MFDTSVEILDVVIGDDKRKRLNIQIDEDDLETRKIINESLRSQFGLPRKTLKDRLKRFVIRRSAEMLEHSHLESLRVNRLRIQRMEFYYKYLNTKILGKES